ncbi:MAG TPA: molybdopterin-dependent oxidoreductase, partial [Polyangiales bacterium]|nr:molybdopterin-dependent oxidoreductase [Polyangiales bacterium]
MMTAPDMRGRLRAILERGGKVVVVDPRRSETAQLASEHVAIKPGGDAAFLLALVQVLFAEGRIDEPALTQDANGWSELRARLAGFTPERVAAHSGVDAETIRRIALEFAAAPSSAAYARIGVCNNELATLASYAIDLLNICAGRLGAVGGSMFPTPAIDFTPLARRSGADALGRWRSRVRKLPEINGDIPASTLAEEMETEGPGQIRALLTVAGNPVLSTPNGRRLREAIAKLDFVVAVDMYVNETTRFADIILPPASNLSEDHVDSFFANFAVRNVARWTEPAVPRRPEERGDWEILLELAYRLGGGPTGLPALDGLARAARRWLGWQFSLDSLVDLLLRTGPYGDQFLPWRKGLRAAQLKAAKNGIDLGPLQPGFARRVFHRDGRLQLAAAPILAAIDALAQRLAAPAEACGDALLLIGRRDLRSNNSWMHNLPRLVAGKPRCTLHVHPLDATRIGVADGGHGMLHSRTHSARVRVEVTDTVRPGVVSLPHGWGHADSAPYQRVAGATDGVSANDWTDDQHVEAIVGQSILNGVRVTLSAIPEHASEPLDLPSVRATP